MESQEILDAAVDTAPVITTSIVAYTKTLAELQMLRGKFHNVVFDVQKTEGNKAARQARALIVECRTALEKARKEEKADVLKRGRQIDGDALAIQSALLALEEPIDAQIKADEVRRERERRERAAQEETRKAAIRARIDAITSAPLKAFGKSAAAIAMSIDALTNMQVGDDFAEFKPGAVAARESALKQLQDAHAERVRADAEQARIKLEREELAARKVEQDRIEAEAKAKRDEAERAANEAREAADRVAQAQRDQEQAEHNARLEAERAAQAEIDRAAQVERNRLQAEHDASLLAERQAQEAIVAEQRRKQEEADQVAHERHVAEQAQLRAERAEFDRQQAAARAERERIEREATAERKAREAEARRIADAQREAAPVLLSALVDLVAAILDNGIVDQYPALESPVAVANETIAMARGAQ